MITWLGPGSAQDSTHEYLDTITLGVLINNYCYISFPIWVRNLDAECRNGKTNQLFWDELHAQITPGPLYLSHFQQADQGTNDTLHREHERLLTIVRCRQLTWFGHVIRWKGSLAKTLLLEGTDGCRKRGRPVWRGWITSTTGLASTFISSSEQLKAENSWVHVFQVPSRCRPNGLQAMGHK